MNLAGLSGERRNAQRGGIFFRLLFLIFFLAFLVVLYLVRNPILRLAGSFWVVDETPQVSNVIVILSDDNYGGDRATRASELFRSGMAPRILASGRNLRSYASIAELMEHDLKDRRVPANAIIPLAHRAEDTREEADTVSQAIAAHGWKKVLLVTSNYHTRRARYIFERTLPVGTELRVIAARDMDYDPDNWWHTRMGVKIYFHEAIGYLVAIWEMRRTDVQTSWLTFESPRSLQRVGFFGSIIKTAAAPRVPACPRPLAG